MNPSQMLQATPDAYRPKMMRELFDCKVTSDHFKFHMASVTKDPNAAEYRVDPAFLYMRHLTWFIGGRYFGTVEVEGLYATINGTVYQDGYLPEGCDVIEFHFSPDPLAMSAWMPLAAKAAAEKFPARAGRHNICMLDYEGNPIIPETLTKEAMEQAFRTIVMSFHTEERSELANLRPREDIDTPELSDRAVISPVKARALDKVKAKITNKEVSVAAPAAQLPPI